MKLLSAENVAEVLDIPKSSAYDLMRTMPHVKLGSRIRVEEEDLYTYIINRKVKNPTNSRAASALYEARKAMRKHG
jgi:hypothetical protein